MLIYLLYNRNTPGEARMQGLAKDLKPLLVEAEMVDADSPRGVQLAENYDVLGRPAVMIVREDGSPVQIWQNAEQLPPATEISYMARQ